MPVPSNFYLTGRRAGTHAKFRRLGRHRRTGKLYWTFTPMGQTLRRRGLLQLSFRSGEWPAILRAASAQKLQPKAVALEVTPHIQGKEANVHPDLLQALERFMLRHAPSRVANIISGFRSYAKQLALWLAYQAGTGNPANRPGSSKHEATGGYKTARAIDTYINGTAFWTWCGSHGLRDEAAAAGLTQPHSHEPWHVEKAGL